MTFGDFQKIDWLDITEAMNTVDIQLCESFPLIRRTYGVEIAPPETPVWFGYFNNPDPQPIPVVAALYNFHLVYPDLCRKLADTVELHTGLKAPISDIRLQRTQLNLGIHRDEGRHGAINCFIRNAESAYVNIYQEDNSVMRHDVQTGSCYYLNTMLRHEVIHVSSAPRYFLGISLK